MNAQETGLDLFLGVVSDSATGEIERLKKLGPVSNEYSSWDLRDAITRDRNRFGGCIELRPETVLHFDGFEQNQIVHRPCSDMAGPKPGPRKDERGFPVTDAPDFVREPKPEPKKGDRSDRMG